MKVAIIAAMQEELNYLLAVMENKKETHILNYPFYEGKLGGKEVVVALSGIGKVCATVGCTLLIENFQPDCILNTGSAGGFQPQLEIEDLVISEEVVHFDADSRGFGYKYGQIPQMPEVYTAQQELVQKAYEVATQKQKLRAYKGLIGSGDSFISNEEQVATLQKHFPNILAAEMEGAAIAQTCHLLEKPFVIIRAISDIVVKKGNAVTFDEFVEKAGKTSAKLVIELLKEL